jgi:transcriptional regulator with AAA-type ATPase domain
VDFAECGSVAAGIAENRLHWLQMLALLIYRARLGGFIARGFMMNHFLRRECQRHERQVSGFTPRAVRAMLQYAFPGNIRELQNLIERGVISAEEGSAIDVAHMFRREQLSDETLLAIGASGHLGRPSSDDPQRLAQLLRQELGVPELSLQALEQRLLADALASHAGNVAAAARSLGLSRAQFAYRLEKAAPTAEGVAHKSSTNRADLAREQQGKN